jgi:hypothetical protein
MRPVPDSVLSWLTSQPIVRERYEARTELDLKRVAGQYSPTLKRRNVVRLDARAHRSHVIRSARRRRFICAALALRRARQIVVAKMCRRARNRDAL